MPVSVKTRSLVPLIRPTRKVYIEMLTVLVNSKMVVGVPSGSLGWFGKSRALTSIKPLSKLSFGTMSPNFGLTSGRK